MDKTLKNTDLMTLISIAQKDETKAEEIKKEIVKAVQDLNASINAKQKKLEVVLNSNHFLFLFFDEKQSGG